MSFFQPALVQRCLRALCQKTLIPLMPTVYELPVNGYMMGEDEELVMAVR